MLGDLGGGPATDEVKLSILVIFVAFARYLPFSTALEESAADNNKVIGDSQLVLGQAGTSASRARFRC